MDDLNLNCVLLPRSNDEDDCSEQEILARLADDVNAWANYYRITESDAAKYYHKQRRRIRRFPINRNGHLLMMEAMADNGTLCYNEFRMYPAILRHFAHVLRDEHGLCSSQQVDIYEQVGMFLCILAHGKGYRQVTTLFNHSLQTVSHYVKEVLRAVLELARLMLRPSPTYNNGLEPHRPDLSKHQLFVDCIGAIDGTHVRAVLPRHERVNFIGRKGVPTQNMLAACDFNLCFTFALAGTGVTSHDARILARAVHSPEIHFPTPAPGKYYLVDSGFAHRPGYIAPYKGSDILYHFQQFRDDGTGRRHQFRNAREKFNFRHSSCRNVVERAFDVWKQRWKILDRMPSYAFRTQVAIVIATMGIHNSLRRSGVVDKAFMRAEEDEDVVEVELPDADDEVHAELNAPEIQRNEWDQLRDYLAQQP